MLEPRLPIRTQRLTLRLAIPADVEAIHAYRSREDVCRYLPFDPMTRDSIAGRVAGQWQRSELTEPGQAMTLVVLENATGTLIGDTLIRWNSAQDQDAEIGYVFDPGASGRGFATEAARALVRVGFEEFRLHRLTALLDARNVRSARLLERLSMRREAHFRRSSWFKGEWSDILIYAMLAEEWKPDNDRPTASSGGSRNSGGIR